MEKKAMFIKDVSNKFKGHVGLFKLDPPYEFFGRDEKETTDYVVVSSVNAMFSGPETYIFPSDSKGNVSQWNELEGSYRGGLDHDQALNNMGYEAIYDENKTL